MAAGVGASGLETGVGVADAGRANTGVSRARARGSLTVELLPGLAAAEALWRRIEADPAALYTPYQRFDWIAAYLEAAGAGARARVAVLRDGSGRARILVPLVVERARGLCVAHTVGDDHANYHLPVFATRDAAAVPHGEIAAALVEGGRPAGIDAYALRRQPRMWEGAANPFAATGEAEASDAYGLLLGPDPEATVRRAFSADARKKLRSKEKRLVEAHGAVVHSRAGTPGEAAEYLAAFYAQKAARFAGMGVVDPYGAGPIRDFLRAASAGSDPAVELHALRLAASGRVLAVFGGAVSGRRFSGMFTAFDPDPEVSRFSPGDLLLQHLVRDQTARGRQGFDLGVGEARYKASICDETVEMVETVLPVTLRGRAYAGARVGLTRLRRRVKRDPRLFAAVTRLRRLRRD